jgi:Cu(I)/Ag(I) efflux system membrane protein CusA/SilA
MGIIICENILKHLDEAAENDNKLEVVYRATSEVGSAVLTAVATTVVSFLPVFTMTGAEGKLFKPLAFTKTFALVASVIVALTIIPPAAHLLFTIKGSIKKTMRSVLGAVLIAAAVAAAIMLSWPVPSLSRGLIAFVIAAIGLYHLFHDKVPAKTKGRLPLIANILAIAIVGIILTSHWLPLGADKGLIRNLVLVASLIGGLLLFFTIFQKFYPAILGLCLAHKKTFLMIPICLIVVAGFIWKGLGKEFMPPLDEGSFLYMPTTMPHASIGERLAVSKAHLTRRQYPWSKPSSTTSPSTSSTRMDITFVSIMTKKRVNSQGTTPANLFPTRTAGLTGSGETKSKRPMTSGAKSKRQVRYQAQPVLRNFSLSRPAW